MARGHTGSGSVVLLERAQELREVDRVIRGAVAGRGAGLLVEGQPGIGKSTLLATARRRGERRGMTVLAARGGEHEVHFPYGVVRQLFEPALRTTGAAVRRRLLAGAAEPAASIVTKAGPEGGSPSPDAAFARAHGLYWLTVNMSLRGPVLIVIDDVQWSDGPSMRFLRYLIRRLDGLAAGLLCSARSGEPDARHDIRDLVAEPSMRSVSPLALSDAAVARIVSAALRRTADAGFAAACRNATGGTPLLVHELAALLVAESVEPTAEHAAAVLELGPGTVAQAMLARLARMPEGCAELARATAVLASEATLPRASALAGLGDVPALAALDRLIAEHVLSTAERLAFVHPIVGAAIYDDLAPGQRSTLHRQAARLLAAEGAELDAVAAQHLRSEAVGSAEVISDLRAAAAHATARGAPENAVTYLGRALQEGGERQLRAALSYELAQAERLAAPGPAMVDHLREVQRLTSEPVLKARAGLELATTLGLIGQSDEAHALLGASLEELGDRDHVLRLRLESLRAGISAGDPRMVADFNDRLPVLRELMEVEPHAGSALAMLLGAVAAWRGESSAAVLELVRRGWDEGRALAGGVDFWGLTQGLIALVVAGEDQLGYELAGAVNADARARGSVLGFVQGTGIWSWIDARHGQLPIAEGGVRSALEPVREHNLYYALPLLLFCAADVMVERPEASDLADLLETVWLGPMMQTWTGALLLDVRGRVRAVRGDRAAAIEDLRGAGEILRALALHNPNGSSWRSALALLLPVDARAEAHSLAADELGDAERTGSLRATGISLRTLGLLEGGTEGRRLLEQAASKLELSGARVEHARALVELGAAMRRAGERSASREPLRAGLDLAVEAGATRLAERARTELAASGARPRRLRLTGIDALTPSELRVAHIAAEGATNNELAQSLFVTPKTVDTHLSHIYTKLGISSRRELAHALAGGAQAEAAA